MNREEKVARLQTLLDRVRTRASQERPPRAAALAIGQQAAVETGLGFDIAPIAPVAMPTADPFDADETRPFAKMPSKLPVKPAVDEMPVIPEAKEPAPLDELDEILLEPEDQDDVGSGGLEIVEDLEHVEPPASSRRPVATPIDEQELDITISEEPEAPRVTPPPESGPQEVALRATGGIEVDFDHVASVVPRRAGEQPHPSVEMVGQTVELEEGPEEGIAELELDEGPLPIQAVRPTAEMEAVIPGASSPGKYPPEEHVDPVAETSSPFLDEPLTNDWVLPEQDEAQPPVEQAKVEESPVEPLPVEEDKLAPPAAEASPVKEDELAPPAVEPSTVEPEKIDTALVEPPAVEEEELAPPAMERDRRDTERPGEPPEERAPAPAREVIAAVSMVAQPGPTDDKPEVVEVKPITVEVAGAVVQGPAISADDIAVFVGAVESFKAEVFVDLLDASLRLGSE